MTALYEEAVVQAGWVTQFRATVFAYEGSFLAVYDEQLKKTPTGPSALALDFKMWLS